MSRFRLSPEAEADLEGIKAYTVSTFGKRQTRKYLDAIRHSIGLVAEFPHMGRPHETETGKLFRRYNSGRHALFYVEKEDSILIVRILHQSMDFDRHLA